MLCLSNIIRDHEPSWQRSLHAVYAAQNLTQLLLAAWALARIVAVQVVAAVLTERARRPTSWPLCTQCDRRLHSKGFAWRVTAPRGEVIGIVIGQPDLTLRVFPDEGLESRSIPMLCPHCMSDVPTCGFPKISNSVGRKVFPAFLAPAA